MEPIDRTLTCAEGYLQLGMHEDALVELSRLTASQRLLPESLHVEVAALAKARRWGDALAASEELIRRAPDSPQGYIHTSFCLHELGRTLEARNRLLAAPVFVTEQSLFYYNLACYEAQLDNPDEAASLLRIAFRRDGSLCKIALADRDLEPVREMVKALVQSLTTPVAGEDGPDSEQEGAAEPDGF